MRPYFFLFLIITLLGAHFCLAAEIAVQKSAEYLRDPDNYYHDANNVGKCPVCDIEYFNNKLNIEKNKEAHKKFFSTPGNAPKASEGFKAWLKQIGVQAAVDIKDGLKEGAGGVRFNLETGELTNGRSGINLKEYRAGTKISALKAGGFSIDDTSIIGFDKIFYDKKHSSFELDGHKIYVSNAPKEGQTVSAQRDENDNIESIVLPAKSRFEDPNSQRKFLALKPLTVFLDGRSPYGLDYPAVSLTDLKILANNKVDAWIYSGGLIVYQSEGTFQKKEFFSPLTDSVEVETKAGNLITVSNVEGTLTKEASKTPFAYKAGATMDRREESVVELQKLLNMNGYGLIADGHLGKKTAAAVLDFQKRYPGELSPTGIVDGNTAEKLRSIAFDKFQTRVLPLDAAQLVSLGEKPVRFTKSSDFDSRAAIVQDIQELLRINGYEGITTDGKYGKKTQEAIKDFQTKARLEPTGELDLETYTALGTGAASGGAWSSFEGMSRDVVQMSKPLSFGEDASPVRSFDASLLKDAKPITIGGKGSTTYYLPIFNSVKEFLEDYNNGFPKSVTRMEGWSRVYLTDAEAKKYGQPQSGWYLASYEFEKTKEFKPVTESNKYGYGSVSPITGKELPITIYSRAVNSKRGAIGQTGDLLLDIYTKDGVKYTSIGVISDTGSWPIDDNFGGSRVVQRLPNGIYKPIGGEPSLLWAGASDVKHYKIPRSIALKDPRFQDLYRGWGKTG